MKKFRVVKNNSWDSHLAWAIEERVWLFFWRRTQCYSSCKKGAELWAADMEKDK